MLVIWGELEPLGGKWTNRGSGGGEWWREWGGWQLRVRGVEA